MGKTVQETRKVKLLSARAGHVLDDHGNCVGAFGQAAGQVVAVSADEAGRMIQRGLAVAAGEG